MKALFFISISLFICFSRLNAQLQKPHMDHSKMSLVGLPGPILSAPCRGTTNIKSQDLKWNTSLTKILEEKEHVSPKEEVIQEIKSQNFKKKFSGEYSVPTKDGEQGRNKVLIPEVGLKYEANQTNGKMPADNSVTISKTGWVVSCMNANLQYAKDGVIYYNQSFTDFFNGDLESPCDPVVIWDPKWSRFFLFAQACGSENYNSIAFAFSKSANPNDGWWYYIVKGDQSGTQGFFDYPKVGISVNDIFVTGNVYVDSKFDHGVIYQIKKSSGYNGSQLVYTTYNDLNTAFNFTLLPVSYGLNDTYGPGIYLVATESSGDSKIGFYDLTDDLGNNPQLLYKEIPVSNYSPGSDALQSGSTCPLDVGDCRTLSGYYQDGIIHFVHNTSSPAGWNALNYIQYNINTDQSKSDKFYSDSWDYAYPAIASYANVKTDQESMITFQRSNSSNYPESRIVYVDGNFNWSNSVYVKAKWEVECEPFGADKTRWGDYSGISRNYSSNNPSVIIAGAYGDFEGYWNTVVAEVHDAGPSAINEGSNQSTSIQLTPNPVSNRITIQFKASQLGKIRIQLVDALGSVIHTLKESEISTGQYALAFDIDHLPNGTYFVQIIQNNQVISNEKCIVQH